MLSTPLIRSAAKFAFGATLGLSVALLTAFNVLLLWVATGPRNIDMLSPLIESSLTDAGHNFSVSIGETWLIWDGWKHPIDIRLRNVSVLTKEHQRFSRFPEISIGVDVLELMRGNILPSSLTISHPVLSLYQADDHAISFGFRPEKEEKPSEPSNAEKNEVIAPVQPEKTNTEKAIDAAEASLKDPAPEIAPVPFSEILNQLLDPDPHSSLRRLRTVTILNADVSVGNPHNGVFFTATESSLVFNNTHKGIQVFGSAKITYDDNESRIDATFAMPSGSAILSGEINFGPLMPGTLADLFASKTEISALKFPVRGKVKLNVERSGTLQNLDFNIDGGKGTIETDRLDVALPMTSLHAEGNLADNATSINLTRLNLDLGGMTIDASAQSTIKDKDSTITGHMIAKNIPTDNLHMLWPVSLAPESREWITKNIYNGTYTQVESTINIAPGDLALPNLPKTAISTDVVMDDASISYLPEHPEVSHIKGSMHIDGVSLDAKLNEGHYLRDTTINNGDLKIDDLNQDNPLIQLTLDAHSTTRDVVKFLGLPRLGHAKRLQLTEDGEGVINGHAELGFHFFLPKDGSGDDLTYNMSAEVKGISQPNLLGKFEVQNATGTMALDNQHIEFKGSGDVNGATATDATIKYLFKPEDGYDTFIDATGTAPIAALPRFGYPAFSFMKGRIGVQTSLKTGDTKETSTAAITLTDTDVDFEPVHYAKPTGEPATLELTTEKKDGIITIPSFTIKGKNLDGKGMADLTKDKTDLARVHFDGLTYGENKLSSLKYEKLEGGFALDAQGTQADMSPWFAYKKGEESTFTFEHFPVMRLNINLGNVILGEDRDIKSVHGTLDCDAERCNTANIEGKTDDDKPFQFRILRNPKGKRQVSLHAESAGPFLKAVGLFDSMEGGDLTITGSYDEKGDHSVLKANADITAYTVKHAPVLAKILSLVSFTGFLDTLQGKGIIFTKLRAPFTLSNDVLTVHDAKTHGDAMGMTLDGTITFPKQTLDLHGTIVPSYSLNTVLGKVPLIGAALMGGEGKGIFAASYNIKGSGAEPDVNVNPLSILTPGFLRGLFDIFDTPTKSVDEDEE